MAKTIRQRISDNSTAAPSGCWEWTGRRDRDGYGVMWLSITGRKHPRFAHRMSYEAHRGTIPDAMTIDHLCRNRACVNPDHLEPVTSRVNTQRGFQARGNDERCRNGHPRAPENVRINATGYRACRECGREAQARYRERLVGA